MIHYKNREIRIPSFEEIDAILKTPCEAYRINELHCFALYKATIGMPQAKLKLLKIKDIDFKGHILIVKGLTVPYLRQYTDRLLDDLRVCKSRDKDAGLFDLPVPNDPSVSWYKNRNILNVPIDLCLHGIREFAERELAAQENKPNLLFGNNIDSSKNHTDLESKEPGLKHLSSELAEFGKTVNKLKNCTIYTQASQETQKELGAALKKALREHKQRTKSHPLTGHLWQTVAAEED